MTLNYAPLLTQQEYIDTIIGFICGIEGERGKVYADGIGRATIGYGYTFVRNNNVALWQAAGISLSSTDLALLQQIDAATTIAEKNRLGLTFAATLSHNNAVALLLQTYIEYEVPAQTLLMPFSFERAAFVSLTYNRGVATVNTRMKDFFGAVQSGNRAEAWYQIRYNSFAVDGTTSPGLPKRRYLESTMFSLYSDQTGMSEEAKISESKDVYRMFTLHRAEIASYEAKFGVGLDGTRGTTLSKDGHTPLELAISEAAGLGVPQVDSIAEALNPARDTILAGLNVNANSDIVKAYQKWEASYLATFISANLYLDPGRNSTSEPLDPSHVAVLDARQYKNGAEIASNDILIGEGVAGAGGDMLVGGLGNDLLIGGAGNDVLWAGGGNDIMAGGAGDDIYILSGGGTYTLEDKVGNDRIAFNGAFLDKLILQADDTYKSPDGLFTAVMQGTDLVVTHVASGDKATLNVDFQSGDFGVELLDARTDHTYESTALTIVGDLEPVDFDPVQEGVQGHFDALGNLIVNGNPDPDRSETLNGSQGADLIQGLGGADVLEGKGGDDRLEGGQGGDLVRGGAGFDRLYGGGGKDRLEGGADNDDLFGEAGQDILQGGAGDDILAGGQDADISLGEDGNDEVYADDKIDLATAVSQGEVQAGSGLKGDWLDGYTGEDILVGGTGDDLLTGGDGADVIVAGAGDDNVYGDFFLDFANLDWSVSRQVDTTAAGTTYKLNFTLGNAQAGVGGGNDEIYGGAGNDWLMGGLGDDVLDGGADADVLFGEEGADTLFGGTGDDSLYGDGAHVPLALQGDDYLDGEEGNDQLQGGAGNDRLLGGDGNDTLAGDGADIPDGLQGDDYLDGEAGDDYLQGDGGSDVLFGGTGNDQLIGDGDESGLAGTAHGDDYLDGEEGDDLLRGDGGADTLFGGTGADTLWGDATLAQVSAQYHGADYLDGEEGDDVLIGGGKADILFGGAGNDTLWGDASEAGLARADSGDDTLDGEEGDDALFGGAGDDTLIGGDGNDELQGDGSTLFVASADDGNDYLDGGAGNDLLVGDGGDDVLDGGEGDDFLWGDDGADQLFGGGGADSLDGGAGDDGLDGGEGDDTLLGGTGNDSLDGGEGNDTLLGDDGDDVLVDSAGDNRLQGGAGNDTLIVGTGVNVLFGEEGDDQLFGGGGVGYLDGGAGNDTLHGGDGNDTLRGQSGQDGLYAGAGNDTLVGGGGSDTLTGEAGNDVLFGGETTNTYDTDINTFVFGADSGSDWIVDFDLRFWAGSINGNSNADVIRFDATVRPSDVAVFRYGSDLLVSFNGSGALQTVTGYFDQTAILTPQDSRNQFKVIEFADGTAWSIATIAALVASFGSASYGSNGDDANNTLGGRNANFVFGYGGDDLLLGGSLVDGGAGNDVLLTNSGSDARGGDGADTYVIGADALVTIRNADGDATGVNPDVIQFDAGVVPSLFRVHAPTGSNGDENALIFSIGNSANSVIVVDYLLRDGNTTNAVDALRFGDGTIWSVADVISRLPRTASAGDDLIFGYDLRDDTIHAGAGNDVVVGYDGADVLFGDAGNDTLRGGLGDDVIDGGAGNDSLVGGDGLDTYVFGHGYGQDVVSDYTSSIVRFTADVRPADLQLRPQMRGVSNAIGLGVTLSGTTDEIYIDAYLSWYSYPAPVHSLEFQFADGTVWTNAQILDRAATTGTANNDTLVGNPNGINIMRGMAGNDSLSSGSAYRDILDGGTGADSMAGGGGDDIYIVDNALDTITEASAAGSDEVHSSVSYTIGANVEALYLTGTAPINGTGGIGATIVGNSASNTLTATKTGYLQGLQGDDTYVFGTGISTVDESVDEGVDTVLSPVAYTLTANVENLTLTGTGAVSGTGNELDNVLTGNSAANTLSGGAGNDTLNGGAGTDTLVGGTGNDTYIVDSTTDTITELANEGTDTVQSSVTITALAANVENLTLTGSSAINATGNTLNNVLTGNSAANTLTGGTGNDTLLGGLGNDIYVLDVATDVVIEFAGEGTDTVQIGVTYALAANVENLTLTGTSAINGTGNALNNVLTGNSAANVLAGGAGDDTYVVALGDSVVENAGEGVDTVQSAIAWTIAAAANVENLTLTGTAVVSATGNSLDNVLTGNSANNTLTGGAGNDTLNGGAGTDTLVGGTGNDTYIVDSTTDIITELANEGTDTVQSSVTITVLAANVENLTLTGSGAINATGNTLNNVLTGNSAANTLTGGTGDDTLLGGLGDDIYVLDVATDVVTELAGEGTDTVQIGVTYALAANVENLTLTGTTAINGTGNALNNVLTGNSAANVLAGSAGDDTYVVTLGDSVIENAGEGIDTVQSAITWTIAAAANVENLTLTGTSAVSATGNSLDNVLTGNSANNTLTGGAGNDTLNGGAGTDTLVGGTGNDTYIVDSTTDIITELSNEGTDTVQSSVTITVLAANVENLTLTGTSAIKGTGNTLNNVLTGNSAANTLSGGLGNDWLDGGAGADTLVGGAGDDTYVVDIATDIVTELAAEGSDTVRSSVTWALGATLENLTLTGTAALNGTGNASNNVLTGNSAANTLAGGGGSDRLIGGLGDDIYVVDDPTDVIVENLGEGTDLAQSSATNYTLGANLENLALTGTAAINGTGNELDNTLTGNTAANTLTGGAGNDTLNGGTGTDTMLGGLGNDTYVVDNAGDVVTENPSEGTDLVQSSLTYTLSANVENLTLTGTTAINATGNALDNVLTGNTANNTLSGGAGNDTMIGGGGVDTMIGGTGNDTYTVAAATDVVTELAGEGTDLIQSSITLTLVANVENLTLTGTSAINATGNALDNVLTGNSAANTLTGGAGNDTLIGGAGTDTLIGGTGDDLFAVDASTDVVTENAAEGNDTVQSSVAWTLATNFENLVLTGSDAIDGTGNAVANLLVGNSGNNTLTGAAGNDTLDGGAGNDTLIGGTGNDIYLFGNGSGRDTIGENDATAGNLDTVRVASGIAPAAVTATRDDSHLYLSLNGGADLLTLQNWFVSDTQKVERVEFANGTVWDVAQLSAITNHAPTVANAIADQSANEDAAFSFEVPVSAFADVDFGDTLTYQATLSNGSALPSWLSFNAATRSFSGTPLNADVGMLGVTVTATDAVSAAVSDRFDIVVANINDAPTVAKAIADQSAIEDTAFSFVVPADSFADVDVGDALTYEATLADGSALPSWLSFDATTRTFSGTPVNADVGTLSVKVTATDAASAAVSDGFDIIVANTNDAPTVDNTVADQSATEDSAFSFVVPTDSFADVDVGDELTYGATLADGSSLPSWLSFDAATRTFSGTPVNADVGTLGVKVTATDAASAAVSDVFDIVVANTNDAPVVANAIADQSATEDSVFSFVVPAQSFADVDLGDTLSYGATLADGSALPSWLSFDTATRTFSGTPVNADVGTLSVTVTATDAASTPVSDVFDIVVANTNDAPVVANAIADQSAIEDSAFSFVVPADSFADVDLGDALSYRATLADGSALPSWLSFDIATRTFSGTPVNADVGTLSVTVTATDAASAPVSDVFDIVVANTNDAPTVANAIADQNATEDSAFSFVVPGESFADVDLGDSLSYGATRVDGSTLPSWLSFDTTTRTFSGTPVNADVGTLSVTVTATDAASAAVSDRFDIVVTNTNDGPTVANAIADQSAIEDSAFRFQVPVNSFADVDAGDTLTYEAALSDGSVLPAWLNFDAATRTFSGNATFANAGAVSLRVTASDDAGLSAADNFDLTVNLYSDLAVEGTSANDSLVGHSGNDLINGNAGADTMAGARGNDTYVVDDIDDVVTELANEGADLVQSSVTYTLAANVENLTLLGSSELDAIGNDLNNVLTGNAGANVLTDAAGDDTYDGAAGDDTFTDTSTTSNDSYFWGTGSGLDTLTDSGGDLDHVDLFGGITAAQLEFTRNGNNLELSILGNAADKLTINGWYASSANQIEEFRLADGSTVLASQVNSLVSAMASFGGSASTGLAGPTIGVMQLRPAVDFAMPWAA